MKLISTLFIVLLVLFGISFAILNSDVVVLDYYFGQHNISLSLLLVFTLGLGAIVGALLMVPSLFRLKRTSHRLQSQLKHHQTEIDNLRSIPLKSTH